jgi:uncharacterized protein
MRVHLHQISPEGLHVEGEQDAEILDLEDQTIRIKGPIRYVLDIGVSESGLFATGTLAVDLDFACVTCLRRFPYTLRVDDFALQTDLDGREMVDLTPFIREDILLALPAYPHCDREGGRVCEGLKNISSEPLAEPDVWEELDKLKIKNN